jgi:hypothetical protein
MACAAHAPGRYELPVLLLDDLGLKLVARFIRFHTEVRAIETGAECRLCPDTFSLED